MNGYLSTDPMSDLSSPAPVYHQQHDRYIDINGVPYTPSTLPPSALTSSFLLQTAFETALIDPVWQSIIARIQQYTGVGNTVWGIKKKHAELFLECYFYYPRQHQQHNLHTIKRILSPFLDTDLPYTESLSGYECLSFDVTQDGIPGINIYIADHLDPDLVIASSWELTPGIPRPVRANTYYSFLSESGFHQDGFHFADTSTQIAASAARVFPKEDHDQLDAWRDLPYLSRNGCLKKPVGVAEKRGAIGLYFMNLGFRDFLLFLQHHEYPAFYIDKLHNNEQQLKHIRYDVGVDFCLDSEGGQVVKTAFFGSV